MESVLNLYHPNHPLLPCVHLSPYFPMRSTLESSRRGAMELRFSWKGQGFYSFISSQLLRKHEFQQHFSKPMFNSQESSSKYQLAHGLQIPATCTYAKRAQTICDKNTRRIQCTNHHQAMLAHFYVLNRCFQLTLNKKTHTE